MWSVLEPVRGFLTTEERQQVEALFSEIMPSDHDRGIPGAREAGATEYISRLLTLDRSVYYEIPAWRSLYRQSLKALSSTTSAAYNRPLESLTGDELRDVLEQLSKGILPGMGTSIEQKKFFDILRRHCIQGCFADPRWGGNKNKIMWRWYGYLQEAEELG